jgi:cytochrome bd ubiquinol oxidase subunit II
MINTVWFIVLAFMLTGYAVLDGFDLGVGAVHLLLGRNREERARLIDAIGPVWNGNEVWLLAAGGSMVAAFPHLYAASFSGFYLPLMMVLWLLLGRGLGIEFRHQVHHPMWHDAWDVAFSVASLLLALLFGVALGNVLHGVPFESSGEFRGTFTLLLNPFSILAGLLSVATLALHGSWWAALKTDGALQLRARRFGAVLWWVSLALLAATIAASFLVRPDFTRNFIAHPWLIVWPLITATGAALSYVGRRTNDDRRAFVGSATYIAGILASVAAGLYPVLLPARPGSAGAGLDIYNAASAASSLHTALMIYLVGISIVAIYQINIYRIWRGKAGQEYH